MAIGDASTTVTIPGNLAVTGTSTHAGLETFNAGIATNTVNSRGQMEVLTRSVSVLQLKRALTTADIVSFDCVPEDRVAVTPFFIQVFGVVNRPLQQLVVRVAAKMLHTV